jgi:hypothetical protein
VYLPDLNHRLTEADLHWLRLKKDVFGMGISFFSG